MQLQPFGIGVSVLCPDFVRTRIGESGRNRPGALRASRSRSIRPARPRPWSPRSQGRSRPASTPPTSPRACSTRSARTNSTFSPIRTCAQGWMSAIRRDPGRHGPGDCEFVKSRGTGLFSAIPGPKSTLEGGPDRLPGGRASHVNMDELKRQAAARALEEVRDGMRLGLGTGSTAKHFVELLGEKVRAGMRVVGVPTSEATRAAGRGLRHCADHARRHRPARSDGRRRRRDRSRAQPDQGRRRGAAAGEDRGGGLGSHDRDRRRHQMGRCARPLSAAGGGDSVRPRGDPARHRQSLCPRRRFRAKWWSGRARTATFLSPMAATGLSTPISVASRMPRVWRAC